MRKMMNIDLDYIKDNLTGGNVANIGAEENRQKVQKFLLEEKDFKKTDLKREFELVYETQGQKISSTLDLVVFIHKRPFMVIKCVAGSIDSWQKEAIAGSWLIKGGPAVFAAASDGKNALIWDLNQKKVWGNSMKNIPTRKEAQEMAETREIPVISEEIFRKQGLIYRTYDVQNVNKA